MHFPRIVDVTKVGPEDWERVDVPTWRLVGVPDKHDSCRQD